MKKIILNLPIIGEIIPLSELSDPLFKNKTMGEGVAIEPKDDFIYSPVDGIVTSIYNTRHAVTIRTDEGVDILIHIGLGTAKLEGRGFGYYAAVGDRVTAGQKLAFIDREYVGSKCAVTTPVVIINNDKIEDININYKAKKIDEPLIEIILK